MTLLQPAVMHVAAPAPFGGLETVLEQLATGQMRAGQRVHVTGVFTEEPVGQPFWESLSAARVPCTALIVSRRAYRRERRAIRELLVDNDIQVLHTHGYRPDLVDAPIGNRAGLGTVTTVHGFIGGGWLNRSYERLQRRAFRRFDAVVAVSDRLGEEIVASGVPAARVHVARNAWAALRPPAERGMARRELGIEDAGPVIGWVGRMTPEKGPDVMLHAFSMLQRQGAQLSFLGDGAMRPSLQAEARQFGARVRFHGAVPSASKWLAAFDAVVLTSWTEGLPMILLEAISAGVPVVTTAVGGVPDVVSDREALLVPAGDRAAIAAALDSVLDGGPLVGARIEAAKRRLARDFAVGPWVERYRQIYESCRKR